MLPLFYCCCDHLLLALTPGLRPRCTLLFIIVLPDSPLLSAGLCLLFLTNPVLTAPLPACDPPSLASCAHARKPRREGERRVARPQPIWSCAARGNHLIAFEAGLLGVRSRLQECSRLASRDNMSRRIKEQVVKQRANSLLRGSRGRRPACPAAGPARWSTPCRRRRPCARLSS